MHREFFSVGYFSKLSFWGRVLSLLALAPWLLPAAGWAAEPQIIPQPREMKTTGQPFRITSNLQIIMASPASEDDSAAAASLRHELKLVTGHDFAVASSVSTGAQPSIVLGRFDQPKTQDMLKARGISTDGIGDQGYVLDVSPEQVLVAGKDGAGLFYGVQTLRQLLVGDGPEAEILGVNIRDWPALRYRGAQVDLARGPVPKLSYLKRIVRTIAAFKMNQLYLYMEDSFRLNGQPLIGLLNDTLTQDDWKQLVAYAAQYHVDLVPATEACGHLHNVLRFEEYNGLAERPHGHVLASGDPHAMTFLTGMYDQLTPIFPSSFYHVGCDETFELGLGRSADLVQKEGYGRVYVDNLIQVYNLVRRYNKQVMFWGDMAVRHPEMIPSLPKDMIVASWEYGPQPSYDKWVEPFAKAGMKIVICPWVGNTSLIVPDYQEAAYNIENFIAAGKKVGAIGADITVWNDDGETLYGPNWWSIVYGAAVSWEPGETSVQDFNRKYDWAFYRNTDHRFADAIWKLGWLNELMRAGHEIESYDMGRGGANDSLFWQNPFSPEGQAAVAKGLPVAAQVRLTAEQAYTVLDDSASRARRNRDTVATLQFAALRMDALGMRYQFAQEISQFYAQAVAHQHDPDQGLFYDALEQIITTNGRIEDLRDYNTRLRELYQKLWLSENLPTWLPNILQRYDQNGRLWHHLIGKFEDIEAQHDQGKPLPPPESLGLLPTTGAK